MSEIYRNYLLQKKSNYTLQKLYELANDTQDENMINLTTNFQAKIFLIKFQLWLNLYLIIFKLNFLFFFQKNIAI